jgi:hypothetical protein
LRKKIKYIGAVATSGRFGKVFDLVKTDVKKPGDYSIAYSDSTKEIFNYNWDKNKDIGKEIVLGNALTHFNKKQQSKHSIPLYDEYSICFSACDSFNKLLVDRMWPYKKGGKYQLGDTAKQDDFAFTCALLNTMISVNEINNIPELNVDFESFCCSLADDLYDYSCD